MASKRKLDAQRAPNFKDQEIEILLLLVKKHQDILEIKKSDVSSWKDKNRAWDEISKEMSSITGVVRSAKTIRDKYKNLKTDSKKKFANEKCDVYKTGGGKASTVEITNVDLQIKELCGVQISGLSNSFDTDAYGNIFVEVEEDSQEDLCPLPSQEERSLPKVLTQQVPVSLSEDFGLPSGLPLNKETASGRESSYNPPVQMEGKKKLLPASTVTKPKDLCSPTVVENTDWSSWNPAKLREKISSELMSPATRRPGTKKKTQLTQDCRIKFNTLSEAKIELIHLQMDCLKKDKDYRLQEHTLRMEQMREDQEIKREDQEMKREKHKIEMEILKKKLNE